ncbi:hypothetical protein BD410DRAFT_788864 [Rickenella mellea]|uniref:MYND-type domain-containing protein n=1 Tax=Rickenella mellea TaxID=50990 RepID=A0A4Y7Q3D7_9AGAM|nr:hypothetical protein BD410DRAFT_788864 [Rickenella mellea]
MPTPKPLQRSACHCTKYCSAECQKIAWKQKNPPHSEFVPASVFKTAHKKECARLKRLVDETPDVQNVLEQFPWARRESDGTFCYDLALAMLGLLGRGREFGWWTQEIFRIADYKYDGLTPPTAGDWGKNLLESKLYGDRDGWKLPDAEIPWLDLTDRQKPSFPPSFEHNWKSYYDWRGLPLSSPACLLLHWPLSVYRLLYLLGFVPDNLHTGSRMKLLVYCIGVEVRSICIAFRPTPMNFFNL